MESNHFLWVSNVCGLISFSISGFMTGRNHRNRTSFLVAAVLTCFGGGMFLRDMLFIGIFPSALIEREELYICAVNAILLQNEAIRRPQEFRYITKSAFYKIAMLVMDALGCGMYLCSGINKGILYGLSSVLCVLAGISCAVGGGILASIWVGVPLRKVLAKDLLYKSMVVMLSIHYYQMASFGTDVVQAQIAIISLTLILCIARALTEYTIHHSNEIFRGTAIIQNDPIFLFPEMREVFFRFTYRGIKQGKRIFPYMRYPIRRYSRHMLPH